MADFLGNELCTMVKEGTLGDQHHVEVEECPHCERPSGGSTLAAARVKFIFGGHGYGFVCHACNITGQGARQRHEELMQDKDPNYEPWDGYIYEHEDPKLMAALLDELGVEDVGSREPIEKFKGKIKFVGDTAEILNELPTQQGVREIWKALAKEMLEKRKGMETIDDNGKEKTRKKDAVEIDDDVLALINRGLHQLMNAKFFVDAYAYIYLPLENKVMRFHSDEDKYRILHNFGLRCTQHHYKLVSEELQQIILMKGAPTHIEKFGCMRNDAIYINNGRGGMIKIADKPTLKESFTEVPNGTDEVFMLNRHLTPWPELNVERMEAIEKELDGKGGRISKKSKLCEHLNAYFEEERLTSDQYQQLVIFRYLSLFLGLAIDLRPILLALGKL